MKLGVRARDKITGFEGIVTGYCQYLTGCHQVLINPAACREGKVLDSEWFDVQRVEILDATPFVLDNGKTPGCDERRPSRRN